MPVSVMVVLVQVLQRAVFNSAVSASTTVRRVSLPYRQPLIDIFLINLVFMRSTPSKVTSVKNFVCCCDISNICREARRTCFRYKIEGHMCGRTADQTNSIV